MSHLQIIVETSPHVWRKRGDGELRPFDEVVQALLVFGKMFLSLDSQNHLRVIAAQSTLGEDAPGGGALFCSERDARVDFHRCLSEAVAGLVERNDQVDLSGGGGAEGRRSNGLVSAFSRALCFVHRARRRRAAPFAHSVAGRLFPARVLLLQASADRDAQGNASMNCIFAAKSLDVVVDGCILAADGLAKQGSQAQMLQQAADRTGGALFDCSDPREALLPQLVLFALPSAAERAAWLRSPAPTRVHLGATCFCHRRAVDSTAWVCSVCLGVFCEQTGAALRKACPTCQTEIHRPGGGGSGGEGDARRGGRETASSMAHVGGGTGGGDPPASKRPRLETTAP